MSWINDVKTEIASLELSKKKLRNFGLLVGGIFLVISILFFLKDNNVMPYIFLIIGGILFLFGAFSPQLLKTTYKIWMGFSFAIGWVISRILLMILFYIIVTPIGLISKLIKKEFLKLRFKSKKDSYWVIKPGDKQIDYTKMY